jgi:hypothetical protein
MGAISGLGVGPVHAAASTTPKSRMRCGFHAGGVRLKLVWCGSMLTAVILAPLALLVGVARRFWSRLAEWAEP